MSELFGKMAESLIAGKVDEVVNLTKEAVDGGSSPQDILEQGLLAGMEVVGKRFKANDMFIRKCCAVPNACTVRWKFYARCWWKAV